MPGDVQVRMSISLELLQVQVWEVGKPDTTLDLSLTLSLFYTMKWYTFRLGVLCCFFFYVLQGGFALLLYVYRKTKCGAMKMDVRGVH